MAITVATVAAAEVPEAVVAAGVSTVQPALLSPLFALDLLAKTVLSRLTSQRSDPETATVAVVVVAAQAPRAAPAAAAVKQVATAAAATTVAMVRVE